MNEKTTRRHQLTPEERRRGGKTAMAKLQASGKSHRFTEEDCATGAAMVAFRVAMGKATRHLLTPEERRRGGLKRQAQLRQATRLEEIYLAGPEKTLVEVAQMQSELDSGEELGYHKGFIDPHPLSGIQAGPGVGHLAGSRFTQPGPTGGPMSAPIAPFSPTPDPFTLSALQRFRFGPKTPFELKRSERGQLDLLRAGGWIEGSDLISLTEKGRNALGVGT